MNKTKIEIVMRSLEWKIEDCKEEVEKARKSIEREMANFNEVTSPMWIAQYGKEMETATDKRKIYEEQKRQLQFLIEE